MDFIVKKLLPDMADDYIDLFDERGFSDGSINKGCYCVWHHWTDDHERNRAKLPENERPLVKRDYAKRLIQEGILNGFVAYRNGKIIGFCNADLKDNYYRHNRVNHSNSWLGIQKDSKVLCIVCYVVDVSLRGKGVASALLQYACKYAADNGYDWVEAYPSFESFDNQHCGGPFSMYEKQGFTLVNGIVRKKLK